MDCIVWQTERLLIRQFQEDDFEEYFSLESDPEVMKYISGKPRTRLEAKERFTEQCKQYPQDPGFGVWAVCLKAEPFLIGTCNLNFIPDTAIRHIGYKLRVEQQGKGFATELSVGLLQYGFKVCGLSELSAVCNPANKASEKVMQKTGLEYVGQKIFLGTECLHYRIEREKWLQKSECCSFTANQ